MIVKNEHQKANLIEAGKHLAHVLAEVKKAVVPGASAEALDDLAERLIREGGDTPAFLGYAPEGAWRAYPASLCVSVNDEIVHGIPNEGAKVLNEGDIVSLDLGLEHEGVVVDGAVTVPVGKADERSMELIRATEAALAAGIKAANPGTHLGDISAAIQREIEKAGFTVVKELGGHGVGDSVHEEPWIANFGKKGTGPELVEGQVLALEPIAAMGKGAIKLRPNGFAYATRDGSRAAHSEHTILIEKAGARIITA